MLDHNQQVQCIYYDNKRSTSSKCLWINDEGNEM